MLASVYDVADVGLGEAEFLGQANLRDAALRVSPAYFFSQLRVGFLPTRSAGPFRATERRLVNVLRALRKGGIVDLDSGQFCSQEFKFASGGRFRSAARGSKQINGGAPYFKVSRLLAQEAGSVSESRSQVLAFVGAVDVPRNAPVGGIHIVTRTILHGPDVSTPSAAFLQEPPVVAPKLNGCPAANDFVLAALEHVEGALAIEKSGKVRVESDFFN